MERAKPSGGQGKARVEIPGEEALLEVLPFPGVILILGRRGGGKTALAYRIAERLRYKASIYAVGIPPEMRRHLPFWIRVVETLQEVPAGAVVLLDESYLTYHARAAMTRGSREAGQLEGLVRHKGWLLILISHQARRLDRDLVSGVDLTLWKEPERLQAEFERPELREMAKRATQAFAKIPIEERPRYTYVLEPRGFEGMIQTALPTFWTEELSRAYAGWMPVPRAEGQEQAARMAGQQAREETRRQAQAERARREWETRFHKRQRHYLAEGWEPSMATTIARVTAPWPSKEQQRWDRWLAACLKHVQRSDVATFICQHLDHPQLTGLLKAWAEVLEALGGDEGLKGQIWRLLQEVPEGILMLRDEGLKQPKQGRKARIKNLLGHFKRSLAAEEQTELLTNLVLDCLRPFVPLIAPSQPAPPSPPRLQAPFQVGQQVRIPEVWGDVGVKVVAQQNGWLEIELPNGFRKWIPAWRAKR